MDGILKKAFIREEGNCGDTVKFHTVLFRQRSKFGIFFSFEVYVLI